MNNNYKIISDYMDNNKLRNSFQNLSDKTFGVKVDEWYQKGLFFGNYRCFSILVNDEIVSNISTNEQKLTIKGVEKDIVRVYTVATDENHRKKGYQKILMEHIFKEYENYDAMILFANPDVTEFYPKFGFKLQDRIKFVADSKIESKSPVNFRKLDLNTNKDIELLQKIAKKAIPNSNDFILKSSNEIFYWFCLNIFRDNIYISKDEKHIVIYDSDENETNIYNIIRTEDKSYLDIISGLEKEGSDKITFYFHLDTDEFELRKEKCDAVEEENYFFVRGDLDLSEFVYPENDFS